jgi:ABC-type bacteriocin/lantibiotic exporter with double-glycine peptidase domain
MSAGRPNKSFSATAGRIETFLGDPTPRLAARPATLVAALGATARALGTSLPPGHEVIGDETATAAIERIAAASGFLARPVPLAGLAAGDTVAPIIAFSLADGEPVVLSRRGRRWSVASEQSGWVPRSRREIDVSEFVATGIMILPLLPDKAITARQLLAFGAGRNLRDLAGFVFAMLLAGCLAALLSVVSEPLFDIVVPGHDSRLLGQIALFLALVGVANLMTRFAAGLAHLRLQGRSGFLLRAAAIDRALRIADAKAEQDAQMPSAPIAALSARSVESWYRSVWDLGLTVATSLLVAAPNMLVMAWASGAGATVVLLVFLAGMGLAGWIAKRRIGALTAGLTSPQSWITTAYEGLGQIETIRAGAAEANIFSRWADGFLAMRHRFLRADRIGSGAVALEAGFGGALTIAAMLALMLVAGGATGATAVVFVMATGSVTGAATATIGALRQATMLALQYRMIAPILQDEPRERPQFSKPFALSGRIELAHVTCRLSGSEAAVLDDVSLSIGPGEHIGIVGPSGAGKSTLLKLLLGVLRPQYGHVLFDGHDLAGLDAAALRRQIGVVGQGGKLFPGTLLDNIAAGTVLTQAEAMDAARLAGLEADLAKLPMGLATPISDSESGFSGGQVQRILLARAFASKPGLIVLDEATSALDPDLQAHVAASIAGMGATVISVAHRLDTLKSCNRIYVLDGGRIVESGSYAELFAANGLFSRFCVAEITAAPAPAIGAATAAPGQDLQLVP